MEKLYYSISEVSQELNEPISKIRFWSNNFPKFIKPQRNAKGNRLYTLSDIDALKQIQHLTKDKGLSLEGVTSQMNANRASIENRVKALESLKAIRSRLQEIKDAL